MRHKILGQVLVAVGLVAGAGVAVAADHKPVNTQNVVKSDADIAKQVRHELLMYSNFTIWDDVSFKVNNGQVEMFGDVTQPYKKDDMERIVKHVPGVQSIASEVRVLPLSNFDDRLRLQVARAIYNDPAFTQYAMMAVPPIHIIVDNGKVTLTGAVSTDFERNIAGVRANSAGLSFSVVNNLQVDHPSKKS